MLAHHEGKAEQRAVAVAVAQDVFLALSRVHISIYLHTTFYGLANATTTATLDRGGFKCLFWWNDRFSLLVEGSSKEHMSK